MHIYQMIFAQFEMAISSNILILVDLVVIRVDPYSHRSSDSDTRESSTFWYLVQPPIH